MPAANAATMRASPRSRRRALQDLSVVALVLGVYGSFAGRYFTSEDFLLIRFLREHPPWHEVARQWTRPWLEIAGIEFFRPLASLVFGVESALFGPHAALYNVLHVAVHAGCALLLLRIARLAGPPDERTASFAPLVAAALFALYPLHPNAVLFAASFATLFSGALVLGAVLWWLRAAGGEGHGSRIPSLALYVAALASYEAAVVLPLILVAHDLLVRGERPRVTGRRTLPFWLASAAYLGWRWVLFGHVIGGYPAEGARLARPQLTTAGSDLAASLARIQFPWYGRPWPIAAVVGLCLAALLPVLVAAAVVRSRPAVRLAAWGWVWVVAAMAPFGFRAPVPGNGRYWYFAAAGLAVAWTATARALSTLWPRVAAWVWLALAAVGGSHALLLWRNLGHNLRAGQQTQAFQGALASLDVRDTVAIAGAPAHLVNAAGVPLAPVFHWGLRDAARPPFHRPALDIYPVPPLADASLVPLTEAGIQVFRWREGGVLERLSPPPASGALLEAVQPESGARLRAQAATFVVRALPGRRRYRLLLVAPGNARMQDLDGVQGVETVRGPMPRDFLATHERLYGPEAEFLWWVEALDGDRPVAHSPVRRFRIEAGR